MKTAYLTIISWVGTVAWYATHYYGHIRFGDTRVDVEFTLNQSDVRRFNKEEKEKGDLALPGARYVVGDTSERFVDRDRLVREAIKLFKKDPHGYDALLSGDHCTCDPMKMLAGLSMKEANSLWREFESYNGWDCQKHEEPEVREICNAWDDIVGKSWDRD